MGALVTILEMQDKIAYLERRLEDAEKRLEAYRYLINYPTDSKEHKDAENKLKSLGEL